MKPATGRARLLGDLAAYRPSSPGESAVRDRLSAFVDAYERCFERDLAIGHVTGSAWVVDRAGTSAILTHHRKLGRWLQLGGHADGESDVRAVALREAVEESGIAGIVSASAGIYDLDIHAIPAHGTESGHLHYDVRYAFFADRAVAPVASEESHEVAWIALAEIDRFTIDDSVRRLVAKTASLELSR